MCDMSSILIVVASVLDLDHGYVRAGEDGVTEQPGLFVAGDVRTKKLRQIVTAVADGDNGASADGTDLLWRGGIGISCGQEIIL